MSRYSAQNIETLGNEPLQRCACVDFSGIVKQVNLAYVPEAGVGDYVMVHVGFAISIVAEDAQRIFSLLSEMGGLDDLGISDSTAQAAKRCFGEHGRSCRSPERCCRE